MDRQGNYWKLLVSYKVWARLTPTLTHVITRDPVTSGAEDGRCYYSPSRNDSLPRLKQSPWRAC